MHFQGNYSASKWSSCKIPVFNKHEQEISQLWSVAWKMTLLLLLNLSPTTYFNSLRSSFWAEEIIVFPIHHSPDQFWFPWPLFSLHLIFTTEIMKVVFCMKVVPKHFVHSCCTTSLNLLLPSTSVLRGRVESVQRSKWLFFFFFSGGNCLGFCKQHIKKLNIHHPFVKTC